MALEKNTAVDIAISGEFNFITVTTKETILDAGEVVGVLPSKVKQLAPMQKVITPIEGSSPIVNSVTYVDTDVSGESTDVQNIAALLWTQAVKDAYKELLNNNSV